MFVVVNFVAEEKPGAKWAENFHRTWPFYQKWFVSEGLTTRPGYLTVTDMINCHMPELSGIYQQLTRLAGGGDLAARYLGMYCPPPYMTGCSQLIWIRDSVALIRNYDYNPALFEGVMLHSHWLKPVIGMVDCNWGLLDGINGDGLVASLTFGGRQVVGEGFGIPLVMRYLLETCSTVDQACEKLQLLPMHMSYNISLLDRNRRHATVYLNPDRRPVIKDELICTNHQDIIEWPSYAAATNTYERRQYLNRQIQDSGHDYPSILRHFFQKPLYHLNFAKHFVTLYTAAYHPLSQSVEILWPNEKSVKQSFAAFTEERVIVNLNRAPTNELIK